MGAWQEIFSARKPDYFSPYNNKRSKLISETLKTLLVRLFAVKNSKNAFKLQIYDS
jgi:hypothetical protein